MDLYLPVPWKLRFLCGNHLYSGYFPIVIYVCFDLFVLLTHSLTHSFIHSSFVRSSFVHDFDGCGMCSIMRSTRNLFFISFFCMHVVSLSRNGACISAVWEYSSMALPCSNICSSFQCFFSALCVALFYKNDSSLFKVHAVMKYQVCIMICTVCEPH